MTNDPAARAIARLIAFAGVYLAAQVARAWLSA